MEIRVFAFLSVKSDCKERWYMALDDVDCVVHAAIIKIVPIAEYNPYSAVHKDWRRAVYHKYVESFGNRYIIFCR